MVELGGTFKFITCKVNSHNCSVILIKLLIFFYSEDAPIIINRNVNCPLHVFTVPILWLHKLATIVGIKDRNCDPEHNVFLLYSRFPSFLIQLQRLSFALGSEAQALFPMLA